MTDNEGNVRGNSLARLDYRQRSGMVLAKRRIINLKLDFDKAKCVNALK